MQTEAKPALRFVSADNGNCRVYYRGPKGGLYCFQVENFRKKTFALYACSQDGEPSHEVDRMRFGYVEEPRGDESIVFDLKSALWA